MKHIYKTFILCILCSVILASCNSTIQEDKRVLEAVESVLELYPDSAKRMLDSIYYPYSLGTESFNKYQLLYVQAKDKMDMSIVKDTVVFGLANYYISKENWEMATKALYYSGKILREQGQTELAMHTFKNAEIQAEKTSDNNMKGLICYALGDLNYEKFLQDEAIKWYTEALNYFKAAGKQKNEVYALQMLGLAHAFSTNSKSAYACLDESVLLAKELNDSLLIGSSYQNMGATYGILHNSHTARRYYRKAISYYKNDPEGQAQVYLNIAMTFDRGGIGKDSVLHYIDKASAIMKEDQYAKERMRACLMLSEIEEYAGNYKEALILHKEYVNKLAYRFEEISDKSMHEIQSRYDMERMKNVNSRLTIHRLWLIISIIIAAFIIAVAAIIIRRKVKEKHRIAEQKLAEIEEQVVQLTEIADAHKEEKEKVMEKNKELTVKTEEYEEKQLTFKDFIFDHFEILKKAALLRGYLRKEEAEKGERLLKKFNEVVYNQDQIDWDIIVKTMNHMYDGLPDRMKEKYKALDETEMRIYLLTYADLNNTEISIVMGLSINTIQSRKSAIRRKLGILGYGNIIDFLIDDLNLPNKKKRPDTD